jgi:hypothetical protein
MSGENASEGVKKLGKDESRIRPARMVLSENFKA